MMMIDDVKYASKEGDEICAAGVSKKYRSTLTKTGILTHICL
jgi:hypothetical protein